MVLRLKSFPNSIGGKWHPWYENEISVNPAERTSQSAERNHETNHHNMTAPTNTGYYYK